MVLELFSDLQSCLLWKIVSEKVRYVFVAQLVHEILLKAFKIDFSNFHDFVNFFTIFFSSTYKWEQNKPLVCPPMM